MAVVVVSSGSQTVGTTSDDYIVDGTGQLTIASGADDSDVVAADGGILFVDGSTSNNAIFNGTEWVVNGGETFGTLVAIGSENIFNGTADNSIVENGAVETVYIGGGGANFTTVRSGGVQDVLDGQSFFTEVESGGTEKVTNGDAGGGTANHTTVESGGTLNVSLMGKDVASNVYGVEHIASGGSSNEAFVYSGGYVQVESGASETREDVFGVLEVDSGGTSFNDFIFSEGEENVQGGSTVSPTIGGGRLVLEGGSTATNVSFSTLAGGIGELDVFTATSAISQINGFAPGAVIDLENATYSSAEVAAFSSNVLNVGGNLLQFDPTQSFSDLQFVLNADGHGGTDVTVELKPGVSIHANDLSYSSTASGSNHFIDLPNFQASYPDLVAAFGTNQAAMQNWYNTQEPIERRVETFDGLDYVASYDDLINAFGSAGSPKAVQDDGATHYINNGLTEGRTTTFNGLDYIASYGDLIKAFGADNDAGAYHYIENGHNEGRTTTFDGLDYIASYPDLIKALGANEQAGAEHFIDNGYKEGRTTTFDGLDYIANYTALMNAFGANNDAGATHYIDSGFNEGRSAGFNVSAYEEAHPDLIGKFASNDAFLTAYINTYKATGTFLT
jgi:autotransporter passenger strand-loop-strand repeat protein